MSALLLLYTFGNVIVLLLIESHCCSVNVLFLVRKIIGVPCFIADIIRIQYCSVICADTLCLQLQSLIAGRNIPITDTKHIVAHAIVLLCQAHYIRLHSNEDTQNHLC